MIDYDAGKTLSFGEFGLSQQGITFRGGMLPWSDVQDISVSDGVVNIWMQALHRKSDKRKSGMVSFGEAAYKTIPNAPVLLMLVSSLVEQIKR